MFKIWLQHFQVHCVLQCTRYPFISSLPLFDFVPMFSHDIAPHKHSTPCISIWCLSLQHCIPPATISNHISILHPPLLQSISPKLSFQLPPWADNGALLFPRWRDKVNPVITGDPHNLRRPLKTCRDVETTLPTNLSTIFKSTSFQHQYTVCYSAECTLFILYLSMCCLVWSTCSVHVV